MCARFRERDHGDRDASDPGSASAAVAGGPESDAVPDDPRVVSLAPSATATLAAMGATDLLVGVTAHCDVDAARDRPAIGGWLNPDYDRLDTLDPDLVCTCDALQADVRDALRERGFRVSHVAPRTLDEVLDSFETIGRAVGRPADGAALAATARKRIDRVERRVERRLDGGPRPVVYCEEWSDPPMAAGNWVPEAVAVAGGRSPFVAPGERSRAVSQREVEATAPEHVVIHRCGSGDRVDPETVTNRGWDVDATVHVVDDSLLNQPSPKLIDGIEALADRFHP